MASNSISPSTCSSEDYDDDSNLSTDTKPSEPPSVAPVAAAAGPPLHYLTGTSVWQPSGEPLSQKT